MPLSNPCTRMRPTVPPRTPAPSLCLQVNATLMNIADSPTNVQLPGVYKNEEIPRVPIVCTGNDFSTLYAPLIRDGRMEKYYWK